MHQLHHIVGIWLGVVYIRGGYVLIGRGFLSSVYTASCGRCWFYRSCPFGARCVVAKRTL